MAKQDAQRGQAVQQRMRGGPSSSRAAAADQSGDSPEARRSRKKAGRGGEGAAGASAQPRPSSKTLFAVGIIIFFS